MVKLNVIDILEKRGKSKYWLFNQINNYRVQNSKSQISYTNFSNLIQQRNGSIRYEDLYELCMILNCKISDILVLKKE